MTWEIEYTDEFGTWYEALSVSGDMSPGSRRSELGRWYEHYVSIADDLYETHLRELRKEGLL